MGLHYVCRFRAFLLTTYHRCLCPSVVTDLQLFLRPSHAVSHCVAMSASPYLRLVGWALPGMCPSGQDATSTSAQLRLLYFSPCSWPCFLETALS